MDKVFITFPSTILFIIVTHFSYRAPEVDNGDEEEYVRETKKLLLFFFFLKIFLKGLAAVDVFSFGMVMCEICTDGNGEDIRWASTYQKTDESGNN